jgi:hypothetical protein
MTGPRAAEIESGGVRPLRLVIAVQSLSYLILGLWPLFHSASFLSLAGPKPDRYQFFATDLLVLAIAMALLIGSLPVRKPDPVGRGLYALAVGTPSAFVLVELWFLEELSGIYWVDFGFELIFLVLLVWFGVKRRLRAGRHDEHLQQVNAMPRSRS